MRFLSPPGAKLFGRVMDREASIIARDSSAESALALGHINGKALGRSGQTLMPSRRVCARPAEHFAATRRERELQKCASGKQIVALE
jgi:hypothetical protein